MAVALMHTASACMAWSHAPSLTHTSPQRVGPIGGGGVIGGEAGVEVLEGRRRLEEALELLLLWCIRRRDAKILERRAELRT